MGLKVVGGTSWPPASRSTDTIDKRLEIDSKKMRPELESNNPNNMLGFLANKTETSANREQDYDSNGTAAASSRTNAQSAGNFNQVCNSPQTRPRGGQEMTTTTNKMLSCGLNKGNESKSSTVLMRKHRRRDSTAGGNFLAQLALHVILLVVLLALNLNHNHRSFSGVEALKLRSFLSSWMPQQQHDDLGSAHSTNVLTFASHSGEMGPRPGAGLPAAATNVAIGQNKPRSPQAAHSTPSLKRPFQSMLATGVGKHPAGHLFSALPRSLFGRIMAGSGNNNNAQAAVKQQQQLQSMMSNKLKLTNQPNPMLWPFVAQQQQQQFVLANYNGQAYRIPAANQMTGPIRNGAQQLVADLMQPNQHPITSFKPTTNNAHMAQQDNKPQHQQLSEPLAEHQKHALGYGEQNDDFVIMNAQQVPELQQSSLGGAVRGVNEEYREMPAIVISEHDLAPPQTNQKVESGIFAPFAQFNSTDISEQANGASVNVSREPNELSNKQPAALEQHSESNRTDSNATNQTVVIDSNSTVLDSANLANSQPITIQGEIRNVSTQQQHHELAFDSSDSQRNSQPNSQVGVAPTSLTPAQMSVLDSVQAGEGHAPADSPESNRQESAAKAVVVPSAMEQPQLILNEIHPKSQDQAEEAIESFILGPYRGLTLQDELVPQTQMEFMDNQHVQVSMNDNYHNRFRPPTRQSNGATSHLLGSASSLIQQARQLIQMPFAHLPANSHFHQLHQRPQHQQPFGYMQPQQTMRRPPDSNAVQQHKWRNEMINLRQPSFFASSVSQPQAMRNFDGDTNGNKQHSFSMANQNRHFFGGPPVESSGNFAMYPSQQHQFSALNNQILHQRPTGFVSNPTTNPGPMQAGPDQNQIDFGLLAQKQQQAAESFQQIRLDSPMPQFTQTNATNELYGKRLHKSGLYQIEPPKLSESEHNRITTGGDEDNSIGFQELQQQKVEAQQEQINQEADDGKDSNSSGQDSNVDNNDDDDADDGNQESQQKQQASAPVPAEPISADSTRQNQTALAELMQQRVVAANQILQVGASFGVSDSSNRSQLVPTEARKGQVFNEPLVVGPPPQQQNRLQQQQQPREQIHQVDTRVFTLPYSVGNSIDQFGNQLTNFVGQQQPHVPRYMLQNQAVGWQMAAQQPLPITFISTGPSDSNQRPVGGLKWPAPFRRPFKKQGPPQTRMMSGGNSMRIEDEQQARANELPPAGNVEQQASKSRLQYFRHQPSTPADFSTAAAPEHLGNSFSSANQQQQSTASTDYPTTEAALRSTTTTPATILVDSSQEAQIGPAVERQTLVSPSQQQQTDEEVSEGEAKSQAVKAKQQPTGQLARSPSSFCSGRPAGLYADLEQRCKAYYQCAPTGHQMFRCNNQTQFNQKTQNCDWWYNVDCGGRLGSPEDFEQSAAASSPRSRVAAVEASESLAGDNESTPDSISTTGPSTTTIASSQEQRQLKSFSDDSSALTSSTASYFANESLPTNSTLNTRPINNSDEQQTTPGATGQQLDQQQSTDSPTISTTTTSTTTNYNHNLIEVVAATAESQPRVGAAPNEETTTTSSPNQTTQHIFGTETVPVTTQASSPSQQRQQQISRATQDEQTKSRRLIQSEFGGSSKNAREIPTTGTSGFNQDAATTTSRQQLQHLTIGELSSLEGQLEEQLRQQEHQSVRLGKNTFDGQQSQDATYSPGSHQGSVSYDPQILSPAGQLDETQADQRQNDQPEQSSLRPTRRRGVVTEPELANEAAKEATKSDASHATTQKLSNPKVERRFGARLAPLVT